MREEIKEVKSFLICTLFDQKLDFMLHSIGTNMSKSFNQQKI